MRVDLPSDQPTSWRDKLVSPAAEDVFKGSEEKEAIDILEGDIQRTFVNDVPSITFSARIHQILIQAPLHMMNIENGYFLVNFQNKQDCKKALSQGPWTIFGQYLTVQPWTLAFDPTQAYPSIVMAWIRFPALPSYLYNRKIITEIRGLVGKVNLVVEGSEKKDENYGPWMIVERKSRQKFKDNVQKSNGNRGRENEGSHFSGPDNRNFNKGIFDGDSGLAGECTVKKLRLSKALTVPESTTTYEACRRMAALRLMLYCLLILMHCFAGFSRTRHFGFRVGDVVTRVIARELNMEETPVSKVMTKNPVFVLSDTLAVEALQKMVQGKFRHLPVVQNGDVIALLDIAKCLYDAIAPMERAAEKGKAIAAVEGQNTFIETLREQMLRPSLSIIIADNLKIVIVSPDDTVLTTTKKIQECRINSAVFR
ncbi:hypothetical protein GOBAR_DD00065 [Gossypium barbadense]|nr:hypothetical protein GOBAR_DD00065 [Gossypium barbadense]